MANLDRFKNLERPRDEKAADAGSNAQGRIASIETERAGAVQGAVDVEGRFNAPAPSGVTLGEADERPPFHHCYNCGAENGPYDGACIRCGKALDTPEQAEHDKKLWELRQRESQGLDAERKKAVASAGEDDRRKLGEALAWEVGRAERRRLGGPGLGGWGSSSSFPPDFFDVMAALWRWVFRRQGR